ncbi:MAG: mechanosensitive ion channel [Myxococcales bacterium]|nr:MAG: mechanosensitive ion channel [Myxococcales bacterium]
MDFLKPIAELLREWLPFLITLLLAILVVGVAYRLLIKRRLATAGSVVSRQLFITALAGIFVILLILALPIDNEPRGQLMSLLGILVTAAVALSSTTLLGNAMAGFMLRSIRNFRAGDFIVVDGHRGRVSELGLLRTEIQTERRNLTTFPNLYLVTNPVTVVRASGTFISGTVSLGYDVPREKIEKCLLEAAENAGLTDPFVFVLELGDFSIRYQAAGFLEEVKYLISAESKLRECMLDSLHRRGIEIVSPTFMNQRQLEEQIFIPKGSERPKPEPSLADEPRPEERMFDKAEIAEHEANAEEKLKRVLEEIEKLDKDQDGKVDETAFKTRLSELEAKRAQLEAEIEQHKEQKKEDADEEETP